MTFPRNRRNKAVLDGNRTVFFWLVSFMVIGTIVVLDYWSDLDACLMYYGVNSVVSVACAAMFADWWRVKGSASSIFKWITVLLFAISVSQASQFVARWMFVYNNCGYETFLHSILWDMRSIPLTVAMIYLLSFALWQRFGRESTYYDTIRNDMVNGFDKLSAKIVDGEVRFSDHSHEGLILDAKIILRTVREGGDAP